MRQQNRKMPGFTVRYCLCLFHHSSGGGLRELETSQCPQNAQQRTVWLHPFIMLIRDRCLPRSFFVTENPPLFLSYNRMMCKSVFKSCCSLAPPWPASLLRMQVWLVWADTREHWGLGLDCLSRAPSMLGFTEPRSEVGLKSESLIIETCV